MLRGAVFGLMIQSAVCGAAWAHHFAIDLETAGMKERRNVHAEVVAPGVKAKTRSVLHVKVGERVVVKWTMTNSDTKASFKNVLVHFFVVKEDEAGQLLVPKLLKDVALESALTMDFGPGEKTRGELSFTLDNAGAYLVRLETIGAAAGSEGHEHYAALDVVAE
jgi:hypothetical protein